MGRPETLKYYQKLLQDIKMPLNEVKGYIFYPSCPNVGAKFSTVF